MLASEANLDILNSATPPMVAMLGLSIRYAPIFLPGPIRVVDMPITSSWRVYHPMGSAVVLDH
jgi:hypothetical protein